VADTETTSRRPYLVRAMHEWISDNLQTPHLIVDAAYTGVDVPRQYVKDGKIVLNVSHSATQELHLGNDVIGFRARFGGAPMTVTVPLDAVLGIYSRESGDGMLFGAEENGEPDPDNPSPPDDATRISDSKRSHLKVVK
jgi:stringent starvation protein B